MNKKVFSIIIAAMAIGTVAIADVTPTQLIEAPIPDLSESNYGKGTPVTYNDGIKTGTSNFYAMDASKWFVTADFSWDTGPSGEENDLAPHLEIIDGELSPKEGLEEIEKAKLYLYYTGERIFEGEKTIVTEFDIKLNTNVDSVRWYNVGSYLWHDGIGSDEGWRLFDSDGTIKGTDYEYPVDEWLHLRLEYEPVSRNWNVYVTDSEGAHHIVRDEVGAVREVGWLPAGSRTTFTVAQDTEKSDGEAKAGFSFDNYRLYYVSYPDNNFVFSPEDEADVDDTEPVNISVNSKGGRELQFFVDDEKVETIKVPSSTEFYTYSVNIDMFSYDDGPHTIEVKRKGSGNKLDTIATRIINYSRKTTNSLKVASVTYDNLAAGQTGTVTAQVLKRDNVETALTFVCLFDFEGGLCLVDSVHSADEFVNLELNLPDDYDADTYKIKVFTFDDPLVISDTKDVSIN